MRVAVAKNRPIASYPSAHWDAPARAPTGPLGQTPEFSAVIQRKPIVSSPEDKLEHEADAVADNVMRMNDPPAGTAARMAKQRPSATSESTTSRSGSHDEIQREATSMTDAHDGLDTRAALREAQAPGVPLPPDVRAYFEPRFGHDFSRVRIHAGGAAANAASGVHARAYTVGHDIVFGAGKYAPETKSGRRLIAHELAHVVQQRDKPAMIQRDADSAVVPHKVPDAAPAFNPEVKKAWGNKYLRETIYPYRKDMLKMFLTIFKKLELLSMTEEDREKELAAIAAQVQARIDRLEFLQGAVPLMGTDPMVRAEVEFLRSLLEKGKISVNNAMRFDLGKPEPTRKRDSKGKAIPIKDEDREGMFGRWTQMDEKEMETETSNFLAKSKKVPNWAKQGVLDYSGMRYDSAAGSYFKPQKLLWALKEAEQGKKFTKSDQVTPWTSLSDEAALGRLEQMHKERMFPDWVWKDIVSHTNLRLNTKDPNWEVTTKEFFAHWGDKDWDSILTRWKTYDRSVEGNANWAGPQTWRAETYRTNELYAVQAVCNEVAEALMRARGYDPSGGLSGMADWYAFASLKVTPEEAAKKAEGKPVTRAPKGSYFRPVTNTADVREGAALFYGGEWVSTDPEASGNKVHPVSWGTYTAPDGTAITDGATDTKGWTYHVRLSKGGRGEISRTRPKEIASKLATPMIDKEYMRWTHVATVLAVDGDRVLTFETTNPFVTRSEKGRSGVGVHSLAKQIGDNTWVGYAPDLIK